MHRVSLTLSLSLPDLTVSRANIHAKTRMQWMTITSSVPSYVFYVPKHVAESPFAPLNQINAFLRPTCRKSLCISGRGISRHIG